MSDAVADVLDLAADHLETDGWRRDPRKRGSCALGAILRATRNVPTGCASIWVLNQAAVDALRDHLRLDTGWAIAEWNDTDGRTKQEVLDALRVTAKCERLPAWARE